MIFTADSLPSASRSGDAYPGPLAESARLVAAAAGLDGVAPSCGRARGAHPNRGSVPTRAMPCRSSAPDATTDAVVVCPIGFVADHLEVLYDLDVELARRRGVVWNCLCRPTPSLNDDAAFIYVLADLVVAATGRPDVAAGRVVVVGGGISGLAAPRELTGGAAPRPRSARGHPARGVGVPRRATAEREVGGRVARHGPRRVPGPSSRGRRPVPARWGSATHWRPSRPAVRRSGAPWRLRTLPEGHAPRGSRPGSGRLPAWGIVGMRGTLGLARDAVLPRPDVVDRSAIVPSAPWWRTSWARASVDILVDPLIGGIHAGSVDDMSAAGTFPPLLAAAERRGGLMRALRAEVPVPDPDGPPLFWALEGGMAARADALGGGPGRAACAPALRHRSTTWSARRGQLDRGGRRRGVRSGRRGPGDAGTGAPRRLLDPHDDEAAARRTPSTTRRSSPATFRVGVDDSSPSPLHGTGFLVPRRGPHKGREPWSVTACTFLDRKWPHLATRRTGPAAGLPRPYRRHPRPGWSERGGRRTGLGGAGCAPGRPRGSRMRRPSSRDVGAFPQYRVHHLCARRASRRRWPGSTASRWAERRTAETASPPASRRPGRGTCLL